MIHNFVPCAKANTWFNVFIPFPIWSDEETPSHFHHDYLQKGAKVLGHKGAVTLAEDSDLLLDVFNLILGLLQVNDLDGHHFLGAVVDAFVDLAEGALANAFQLSEVLLWIQTRVLEKHLQIHTQTSYVYFVIILKVFHVTARHSPHVGWKWYSRHQADFWKFSFYKRRSEMNPQLSLFPYASFNQGVAENWMSIQKWCQNMLCSEYSCENSM